MEWDERLVTRDRFDGSPHTNLTFGTQFAHQFVHFRVTNKTIGPTHIIDCELLFFSPVPAINHRLKEREIGLCYYYSKYSFAFWQNIPNLCEDEYGNIKWITCLWIFHMVVSANLRRKNSLHSSLPFHFIPSCAVEPFLSILSSLRV